MKPFRTRQELFAYAESTCPTKAVETVFRENRATSLGGFTAVEGLYDLPCFVVTATTKHRKTWFCVIACDEPEQRYRTKWTAEFSETQFRNWLGHPKGRRLIDGDTPGECYERKQRQTKPPNTAISDSRCDELPEE